MGSTPTWGTNLKGEKIMWSKSIEEFNVYEAVSTIHITHKSFFEKIKSYFRRNQYADF